MNFSLNFFKSEKQKELEALKVDEQKIKNDILRKKLEKPSSKIAGHIPVEYKNEEYQKPYKHLKLVNDVLIVVMNDGQIMTKPGATASDFDRVVNATSYSDILSVIATQEVTTEMKQKEAETEKIKALLKGIELLRGLSDFDVKGNSVSLRGTNRSLPQLLVEKFIEIINEYREDNTGLYPEEEMEDILKEDEEYQALKRFFMWCCLNPRAEVADKLYDFLQKNSFRITKQGFFVALRNVVSLSVEGTGGEIVQFISNSYNKVKAVWKKKPEDYAVYEGDNGYYITKITIMAKAGDECKGNLKTLYMDLPNMMENRFTDAYTKTFDIRIGVPVSMPPEQCSWSTADCAESGLHFTADEIHYVGCGDTSVLCLINPMKVVGIGESKGRCYEYLPIMTVPREEATEILHDLDFDTLELDEDYAIRELEGLEEKAKNGFVAETTKHEFNLPQMSTTEINNIVLSLKEMEKEISKRVSVIK